LRLAVAALIALGAANAEAAAPCPAAARVDANLPAWRAALQQADGAPRRDELLAALGLTLDPPDDARVTLLGVDDLAVQLEPEGRPDHLVHARYAVGNPGDETTIHLVQVLRPLEGRKWCALGSDLGRRDDGPRRLVGYELAFVPLLAARGKALEVRVATSELRRNETRQEYWVAAGWKLRKVFDQRTGSMDSSATGAATTTKVGKLTLAGGFPRRIELTEVTKHGGCEAHAGDAPCDDSEPTTSFTFVYDGAQYVRKK
jgi:hypothetical protein